MTEGKMKRILNEYIVKYGEDRVIYKVYDKYAKGKETPRNVYTIKNVLDDFNAKSGVFYTAFKVKTDFMSLLKHIDDNQPIEHTIIFEDTYEQWKKDNPDWKEQLVAEKRQREKDYQKLVSMYKQYIKPYRKIK